MPFSHRIHNFGAGPSLLPEPVLQELNENLWNYRGSGLGLMEINHRSSHFDEILEELQSRFRNILRLPDSHEILFLPGGASLQFALIPLHLLEKDRPAGFVHTGHWTQKAIDEAERCGPVKILESSEDKSFLEIPNWSESDRKQSGSLSYLHICSNNTIEGTQWSKFPDHLSCPLVVDMSSDFLSRDFEDWTRFDLIFGGLQKNLGAASISFNVIRKDLIEKGDNQLQNLPRFLSWKNHQAAESRLNTPHTLGLYLAVLLLRWMEKEGGLLEIEKRNKLKAETFYSYLDSSSIFKASVETKHRSLMNIVFDLRTKNEVLARDFLNKANSQGFAGLEGHRVRGGFRASFYNAQSLSSVQSLISFMKDFEKSL